MREAADVINDAVENFESICIYGDYDCDGITSTVILFSYLECMGANVTYYIPERSEGYGLNADAVRELAKRGVNLIITCLLYTSTFILRRKKILYPTES